MSRISECPNCGRQVKIPDGFDEDALVSCPICDAEFPLSQAISGEPPQLVPVASVSKPTAEADTTRADDSQADPLEADDAKEDAEGVDGTEEARQEAVCVEVEDTEADVGRTDDVQVEEVEVEPAPLNTEAQALQARAEALSARAGAHKAEGEAIEAEVQALKADAEALALKAAALQARPEPAKPEPQEPVEEPTEETQPAEVSQEIDELPQIDLSGGVETAPEEHAEDQQPEAEIQSVEAQTKEPAEEAPPLEVWQEVDELPRIDLGGGVDTAPETEAEEEAIEGLPEIDLGGGAETAPQAEADEEAAETGDAETDEAGETDEDDRPEPDASHRETADLSGVSEADAEALAAKAASLATVNAALEAVAVAGEAVSGSLGSGAAKAEQPIEDGPQLDVWRKVAERPRIVLGEGDAQAVDRTVAAGAFDFHREEQADGAGPAATARRRPKRKKKSLFRELVGAVVGGVLGVAIGYYVLNYFGGSRFDILQIYLPGVPHTHANWPGPDWSEDARIEPQPEPTGSGVSFEFTNEATRPAGSRPAAGTDPAPGAVAKPPPAQPKADPLPADYVGLRVPPSYSSAELGKALKAADAAFGCHKCNSTGSIKGSVCPECQGHPPDAMTPAAYRKFCRLGEVLTFAADKADVAGLARRKSAGRDLLVLVGKNAAVNVPQTGDLASRLLDSPERDGNGILLGGTILEVHAQDKGHAAKLKLAKVDSTVLLLSKTALPLAAEDRVLVLGSIVDDPAEKLVGFDTPQPPVVWFGARAKF